MYIVSDEFFLLFWKGGFYCKRVGQWGDCRKGAPRTAQAVLLQAFPKAEPIVNRLPVK